MSRRPCDSHVHRLLFMRRCAFPGVSAFSALPYACEILAQFGDGIISMIDCQVTVDKKEDPKGDRVLVQFE